MKYLYYCNSTYQLINAINLHWNRKFLNYENISNYTADLVVLDAFGNSEEVISIVKKNYLFNTVYLVNKVRVSGKFHLFKTVRDLVFPCLFLKRDYNFDISKMTDYDVICAPKFNRLVGALWQINKKARFQIHEDGLATYVINYDNSLLPKSYQYLYKFFNHNRDLKDLDAIYVNNLEIYNGNRIELTRKIPSMNEKLKMSLIEKFNMFSRAENENKKLYWLAQFDSMEEEMDDVLAYLSNYRDEVIYCHHPRNKTNNKYNYDLCESNQMWELKMLNTANIDDLCLISFDSTALISPFILFNKQPTLIFTYKMSNLEKEIKEYKGKVFQTIRKGYRNKDKIMEPENINEFKKCILEYKEKYEKTEQR